MRLTFTIFTFLLCASNASAQERKVYNSLLWEISGNGMAKPSYLYGTMHVSKKMVFNVSDSFFVALKNTDAVALEQDPSKWMDEMVQTGDLMYKNPRQKLNGFDLYNAFLLDSLTNDRLSFHLARYNGFANQLLYRNSRDKEFEEDTYLDLFIYQSAAKRGKKLIGLEKNEEVQKLDDKANESAYKRERDYYYYPDYGAMEDAYRKGDLNKLDSLQDLVYFGTDYRLYMLDTRNDMMVHKLDSILKTSLSVFTGVGAAHLPGEMGMIELLRKKGYQVRAVSQKSTDFAQAAKREIEEIIKPMSLVKFVAPDSSFQANLPGKMYLVNQTKQYAEYFYPEMTNGTYYTVSIFNTFNPLFGQNHKEIASNIVDLLYENIPGKIINREVKEQGSETHIYVTNETRKGDHQQYHIIVNAQMVLLAKVSGTLAFGKSAQATNFVNSVQLLNRKAPKIFEVDNFAIELPSGTFRESFSLSKESRYDISSAEVNSDNGYFALLKATYRELEYIEEDSFEVNFLLEKFALSNSLEISNLAQLTLHGAAAVKAVLRKPNAKDIHALVCLNGNDYFFLLATGSGTQSIENFAKSIKAKVPIRTYDVVFEDTLVKYKVLSDMASVQYNKSLLAFDKLRNRNYMGVYESYFGFGDVQRYFADSLTSESILVRRSNYGEYAHYKDADAFWKTFESFRKDDELEVVEIEKMNRDGVLIMQRVVKSKNSIRAIHEKFLLKGRTLYSISAMGDSLNGISARSKVFFESFEITDTVNQTSLFENRKSRVLEHLVSEDSITAVKALLALNYVQLQADDVPEIVRLIHDKALHIQSFFVEFKPKETFIKCLGRIQDDKAINALRELYYANPDSAKLQAAVLMSLSGGDSKKQFATMRSLLLSDVPYLQSSNIQSLFKDFYANLKRSSELYPDILRLTRNQSYRQPVYVLLAELLNQNLLKSKTIKPYLKDIVNDANEEIKKRLVASKRNDDYGFGYEDFEDYNWSDMDFETMLEEMQGLMELGAFDEEEFMNEMMKMATPKFDLLEAYILILSKFEKDHGSISFFQRLSQYLAESNQVRYQVRLVELGLQTDKERIGELSANVESRYALYQALKRIKRLDLFDAEYLNQHDMALAILAKSDRYSSAVQKDSITFLEKRFTICKGNKKGYVYFFKRYDPKTKRTSLMHIGLMPEDEDVVDYLDVSKSSGKRLQSDSQRDINQMIDKVMMEFKLYNRNRLSMRYSGNSFDDYDDFFDY